MSEDEGRAPPPPEGFVASTGRGGFSTRNGPYFHRLSGDTVEQAFFARPRHCNGLGLIHGGMLAAFLDGMMAGAAARAAPAGPGSATPVTLHLSLDFLGMGRAGDWVLGEARVTRATREIVFVDGSARMRGRALARATGLFKLMKPRS